jgi:hypothetical protein
VRVLTSIARRRADGSYIGIVNGREYHVIEAEWADQWPAIQAMGAAAPLEPVPDPPTAAELLAAERAQMIVTRLQFARQSALAGMMTAAEARAWAGAGTDTAMGTAALALVPEGTARDQASIVFAAATTIDRNNALMPALQAVAGLTDEQTDDFFRAAALL